MRLIVETSGQYCVLALVEGKKVVKESIFLHQNALSSTLVPAIETLLAGRRDLTAVAVGIGPGSYTGTRVGVAVGKTLGFALGIPVIGFCSLLAYLPSDEGSAALIMANRSQKYYLVKCTQSQGTISVEHSGPVSAESLPEKIGDAQKVLSSTEHPFTPNVSSLALYLDFHADALSSGDELIYLESLTTETVEKIPPLPIT